MMRASRSEVIGQYSESISIQTLISFEGVCKYLKVEDVANVSIYI